MVVTEIISQYFRINNEVLMLYYVGVALKWSFQFYVVARDLVYSVLANEQMRNVTYCYI